MTTHLNSFLLLSDIYVRCFQDVSRYIIRHDNNSITEIIRYFSRQSHQSKNAIKASQIRDSLLILLQQNCLQLEPDTSVELIDGQASVFLYRVNLDMVINRLRFPKFLSIVDNLYGELAVKLVEDLIFHGRLRFDQVVEDVVAQQKEARTLGLQQLCTANNIDINLIEDPSMLDPELEKQLPSVNSLLEIGDMFEKLAENRFIVPAPSRSSYVASAETVRSEMLKKEKAVKTNKLMDGDGSGGGALETLAKDTSNGNSSNGKVTIKRSRQEDTAVTDLSVLPVELQALMQSSASEVAQGASHLLLLQQEGESDAPPTKAAKVRGARGRGGRGGRGGGGGSRGTMPALEVSRLGYT